VEGGGEEFLFPGRFWGDFPLAGEIFGDGRIVLRGVAEGLERQAFPGCQGDLTLLAQLGQHERIVGGVAEDGHGGEVLGRRPQQGHAADVYLLQGLIQGDAGPGHRLGEGVEVDDHHVQWGDAQTPQFVQMGGLPAGQNAAVNGRVQGFDPPIQDFWKSGDLLHGSHGKTGLLEHAGGAAGGDEFHPHIGQPPGQFHQTGLVGNAEQGSLDRHHSLLVLTGQWL